MTKDQKLETYTTLLGVAAGSLSPESALASITPQLGGEQVLHLKLGEKHGPHGLCESGFYLAEFKDGCREVVAAEQRNERMYIRSAGMDRTMEYDPEDVLSLTSLSFEGGVL